MFEEKSNISNRAEIDSGSDIVPQSFEEEIFDPSDGSPYMNNKRFFSKINIMYPSNQTNKNSDSDSSDDHPEGLIYHISKDNTSPFIRKYPNDNRIDNGNRFNNSDINDNISTTATHNDFYVINSGNRRDEYICNKNDNIQEIQFPIEIHRHQSMSSVRHHRDPHFQGIRSRKAKRVINKSGERNIGYSHIPQKSWRFLKDFVNTLIDEQWRYVITVFFLSFFLCWIIFAILWYLIAYAHGDLKFDQKTGERLGDGTRPCIENAFNFVGFLLFSIETQVTIGYGSKYPNEDCPEAIFLMVAQIVCGVAIEGAMVGIVYAKMIRPPRRSSSMQFSKKAVVCQRDSKLCLVFRVCDSKENQAISSRVHAYWFEERRSPEGEQLRNFQHSLQLENDGKVFLIFPVTICHVIDRNSPLYDLSAKDLLEKKFEIVVTLTGLSNLTGQMIQARTSYLPREIMWGNRFVNMVRYDKGNEVYAIDFDRFDELMPIDSPLCSAKRLEEVQQELFFASQVNNDNHIQSQLNLLNTNKNENAAHDDGNDNNDFYILSPKTSNEDEYISIRFKNEYKMGEGSVGCLETRFSKEVSATELMTRLMDHRRSLDIEQYGNNSTAV